MSETVSWTRSPTVWVWMRMTSWVVSACRTQFSRRFRRRVCSAAGLARIPRESAWFSIWTARWIVGRQVEGLEEGEILRAAAETTAENGVDGLFAPLFWMLVGAFLVERWRLAPGPLALAFAFKASKIGRAHV